MKDLDLVLFGATGYTGALVAERVARAKPPLRIALAGRDAAKLAAARGRLGVDWSIEVADALDEPRVGALAARARVVCTTVGPYSRLGGPLVRACAEHGTDYCDLTGELQFIRGTIDACHARAKATGARLVHACGFDSIPSDLGVFVVHERAAERGERLARVRGRVALLRGGVSGGTAASAIAVGEAARDARVRKVLLDPHALGGGAPARRDGERDALGPRRDPESGHWVAPFFMAPVNTRVVRRTNALLGGAYGERFTYDEVVDAGAGLAGFARAVSLAAATSGLTGLLVAPGGAALLRLVAPKPGEGPSPEARARGGFRLEIDATTERGAKLGGVVAGESDPGYGETPKMLAEAALCLALDPLPRDGGVLTPAACMGEHLVRRLRAAGLVVEAQWR